jgi:hypothetical protein
MKGARAELKDLDEGHQGRRAWTNGDRGRMRCTKGVGAGGLD